MKRAAGLGGERRVLLFGPLPISGDVIGGTKVLFERMVAGFEASPRWRATTVNTSRSFARFGGERSPLVRAALDALGFARSLLHLALRARAHDVVVLNASSRGVLRAGPTFRFVCRLLGRPLVVRVFGGDFGMFWDRASRGRRALARRTVLKSHLLLLETEALCRRFSPWARTQRFANTRDVDPSVAGAARAPDSSARFAFVGQMRVEKGVLVALEASDSLPEGGELVCYGPFLPGLAPAVFDAHPRARHAGVLAPEDVAPTLAAFDALVFPTLYRTEGMPGVVLEAMQCGVPVIASRWDAAEELVHDGESGLLVDRGSARELADALLRLTRDGELRARLCRGARAAGDAFRTAPWQARLEGWLDELVHERTTERASQRAVDDGAALEEANVERSVEDVRGLVAGPEAHASKRRPRREEAA